MAKWVFIDAGWVGHRARYALKGLDMTFAGSPTGVVFGFLNQLVHVCSDSRTSTNQCAVIFDSKYSFRKQEYPQYKAKRHEDRTEEEWAEVFIMHDQLKLLRTQLLPDVGFRVLYQIGVESDDLMAMAASQLQGEGAVMVTADHDLYQCISRTVHWYDPARNIYLDEAAFLQKTQVSPRDWPMIQAMAGCTSDNVAGVPGVGEVTALNYHWRLLPASSKRFVALASDEGQATIKRNLGLVKMPHASTLDVDLSPVQYRPEKFWKWAEKLGFASLLEGRGRQKWEDFFAGSFSVVAEQMEMTRKRGDLL